MIQESSDFSAFGYDHCDTVPTMPKQKTRNNGLKPEQQQKQTHININQMESNDRKHRSEKQNEHKHSINQS